MTSPDASIRPAGGPSCPVVRTSSPIVHLHCPSPERAPSGLEEGGIAHFVENNTPSSFQRGNIFRALPSHLDQRPFRRTLRGRKASQTKLQAGHRCRPAELSLASPQSGLTIPASCSTVAGRTSPHVRVHALHARCRLVSAIRSE
ncbi:hypothetical protein L1887_47127 [Cichorium endivia]|nr:hypothetical protein L1887_47127 [Cichorium endivia]